MSRDNILQRLRKNAPISGSLPVYAVNTESIPNELLLTSFKENLAMSGGKWIELEKREDIPSAISEDYPMIADATKQDVWEEYSPSCSKEKLAGLETLMVEGQVGVAENGAIWLDESNFPNRLSPFIAKNLIIVLDEARIVGNMHEAYRQIKMEEIGFGAFISGPSKTADIEQSLVYGAHGPVSLLVVLIRMTSL